MKVAGLIYGKSFHYIDHLAPLCHLLGIPLIVSDEEVEETVKVFYPRLTVICISNIELPCYLIDTFSVLFVCTPRILFNEVFGLFEQMHRKKIHTIWCPHGNSDKGHKTPFMEGLAKDEVVLVYGTKMIDFLREKNVFSHLKGLSEVSNYRKLYYEENRLFYDALIQDKILRKLPEGTKKILYAPTWDDAEGSSSLEGALPFLSDNLPEDYVLLVKPHPNALLTRSSAIYNFLTHYENQERVMILPNFPPVYPILSAVDLYIGDMSSIGYDALSFKLPLFFLNKNRRDKAKDLGLYLYQCGIEILPEEYPFIYGIIKQELPVDERLFGDIRKEVYHHTFGADVTQETLREQVKRLYSCFPEEELNFF